MIIISKPLSIQTIREKHGSFFQTMVKIVVDVERKLLALDAEMHADLEELLLENESSQQELWGANLYFDRPDYIEFTSLINIRPGQGNKSMEVMDPAIRQKMQDIVHALILF